MSSCRRLTRRTTGNMITRPLCLNKTTEQYFMHEIQDNVNGKYFNQDALEKLALENTPEISVVYHDHNTPDNELVTTNLDTASLTKFQEKNLTFHQLDSILVKIGNEQRHFKGVDSLIKAYVITEENKPVVVGGKSFDRDHVQMLLNMIYHTIVLAQSKQTNAKLFQVYAYTLFRISDKLSRAIREKNFIRGKIFSSLTGQQSDLLPSNPFSDTMVNKFVSIAAAVRCEYEAKEALIQAKYAERNARIAQIQQQQQFIMSSNPNSKSSNTNNSLGVQKQGQASNKKRSVPNSQTVQTQPRKKGAVDKNDTDIAAFEIARAEYAASIMEMLAELKHLDNMIDQKSELAPKYISFSLLKAQALSVKYSQNPLKQITPGQTKLITELHKQLDELVEKFKDLQSTQIAQATKTAQARKILEAEQELQAEQDRVNFYESEIEKMRSRIVNKESENLVKNLMNSEHLVEHVGLSVLELLLRRGKNSDERYQNASKLVKHIMGDQILSDIDTKLKSFIDFTTILHSSIIDNADVNFTLSKLNDLANDVLTNMNWTQGKPNVYLAMQQTAQAVIIPQGNSSGVKKEAETYIDSLSSQPCDPMNTSEGGAHVKVKVLGRTRNILIIKGHKYVTVQGEPMLLSKAQKLENKQQKKGISSKSNVKSKKK